MRYLQPAILLLLALATLLSASWEAGAIPETAPTSCQINFTTPLFVPRSGDLNDIVIDDACKYVYVTNGTLDRVEVFSIGDNALKAPIPVGPQPWGLDVTPDGSSIYVANFGANSISVVDPAMRSERRRIYVPPLSIFNDTPYSVAIADNGLALFSTATAGVSGYEGRVEQLDLATDAVTLRTDFQVFPGSPHLFGRTTSSTFIKASGDRSKIGIVVGNISDGPAFLYDAATDSFPADTRLNDFLSGVGLNGDGSTLLLGGRMRFLDSSLALLGSSTDCAKAVAIDPLKPVGYRAIGSQVEQMSLPTFEFIQSLELGDDSGFNPPGCFGGPSRMAISRDGRILAVITENGFSLVRTIPAVGGIAEFADDHDPDVAAVEPVPTADRSVPVMAIVAALVLVLGFGGLCVARFKRD